MNETMLNNEEMEMLDAYILRRLIEKQEAIGTTDKALGDQAFGWITYPNMKILAIKGKGGRKPQQLRLADFLNLCEALGLSWQEVCRDALKNVKNK